MNLCVTGNIYFILLFKITSQSLTFYSLDTLCKMRSLETVPHRHITPEDEIYPKRVKHKWYDKTREGRYIYSQIYGEHY